MRRNINTLMMEALYSSETTRRNIPEDGILSKLQLFGQHALENSCT
jgi:hypothetical protein